MNFGRPARTVVTVEDKETHDPLLGATVSIVSRADTLRGTTVKEDFYRIMAVYRCDRIFRDSVDLEVTYVGYKPFKKRYGNTEFRGRIEVKMEVDEQSIAQVVVVGQQVAMVFRGDTTVYNAGAFKTMADDRFAELLKQLPGVEIKDNKIYAEGQEVKRVLIDGKNLFGSKTSYALTDLEASDVRSVRVYEDFSPEAKRLGDNTAEKEKVMDVETKSKRGYILGGNLEGTLGASLERDYSGRHEIRHSEAGSFYRNTERGNWRLEASNSKDNIRQGEGVSVRLEDDPHETDRRPGGLYPAPGRLDQRIDRRPVRTQPPEQHGVLADRIFPDRSLCPAQRGEPERIALEIAFGGDLELRQHPAEEEGFRGHDHLFDRRRLHTRAQPHAAADRRRKDPDEPQQQLRQTQHPIECQHFLPLENFRTVDPVVQRLGQIRTRRPGRLAGRHDRPRHPACKSNCATTATAATIRSAPIWATATNWEKRVRSTPHTASAAITPARNSWRSISSPTRRASSTRSTPTITRPTPYTHSLQTSLQYRSGDVWIMAGLGGVLYDIARSERFPKEERFPRLFFQLNPTVYLSVGKSRKRFSFNLASFPQMIPLDALRSTLNATNPLSLQAGNPGLKLQNDLSGSAGFQFTDVKKALSFSVRLNGSYTFNYIAQRRTLFLEDTYLPQYDYTARKGAQLTTQANVGGNYNLGGRVSYSQQINPLRSTLNVSVNYGFSQTPYFTGDDLFHSVRHSLGFGFGFDSGFSSKVKLNIRSNTSMSSYTTQKETAQELREQLTARVDLRFGKYFGSVGTLYEFYCNSRSHALTRHNVILNASAGRKFGKENRLGISVGVIDILNRPDYATTSFDTDYIVTSSTSYLGRYGYLRVAYTF